jgi:DNA-binding winged helix-turn-helix (wHTH) protein
VGERGDLRFGALAIDVAARRAVLDGRDLDLTRTEFDLLAKLAAAPGTVIASKDLLSHVWDQEWTGDDTSIETHVSRLRKKLGETASSPRYVHTVRGVGYRFEAPKEPARPPGDARRKWWLIAAAATAAVLAIGGVAVGLVRANQPAPAACAPGYDPCIPVADDVNCAEIKQLVTVTGDDPYGLDKDGDGFGCQLYAP